MNGFKNVISNCHRATFLVEQKLMGQIGLRETLELRLHLAGCRMCRLYVRQSRMIAQMISLMLRSGQQLEIKLDDQFRTELQLRLEKVLNKY